MFVSKLYSNLKEAYSKLNPATLSGAIDAIIVEQPDGTYWSSPFHVRFGKLGILQPKEREVDIEVNGHPVELKMVLDDNGTAYFMPPMSDPNENSTGLSPCDSSILNAASSTEDMNELLSPDENEDHEIHRILSMSECGSMTDLNHGPMPRRNSRSVRSRDPAGSLAERVVSEPEQSPISSPTGSRPPSPGAKSDSETNPPRWSIKESSKISQDRKQGGVFLDDLTTAGDSLLYLGHQERDNDDDVESGRGISMPQSPQPPSMSVRQQDSVSSHAVLCGSESSTVTSDIVGDVALSLCGPLIGPDCEISLEDFLQYRLSWEAFERDPLRHISNPDLFVLSGASGIVSQPKEPKDSATVIKVRCLPWSVYSVQMAAQCAFGHVFSIDQLAQITARCCAERMALGNDSAGSSSWFRSLIPRRSKPAAPERISGGLRPIVSSDNMLAVDQNVQSKTAPSTPAGASDSKIPASIPPPVASRMALARDVRYATDDDEDDNFLGLMPDAVSGLSVALVNEVARTNSLGKERVRHPPRRRGLSFNSARANNPRRTRRLTTEQVKSLGLVSGENNFAFSLSHQLLGTTRLTCRVFVWRWDDRLVVSDIDGTITRSDVLGQVLPIMGYEWTQPGVSRLFSLLVKNNYKILYLSARAIGLAQQTREYLCSINDLPSGPLLLSPASLVNAFYKEVIERVPERFKINCLKEIMRLFPNSSDDRSEGHSMLPLTPFYAGFGNRPNDAKAYRAVNIPPSRIYIVNPRAEVRHDASSSFKSTYDTLAESVDLFFPAYAHSSSPVHNEFSSFEYWRTRPEP